MLALLNNFTVQQDILHECFLIKHKRAIYRVRKITKVSFLKKRKFFMKNTWSKFFSRTLQFSFFFIKHTLKELINTYKNTYRTQTTAQDKIRLTCSLHLKQSLYFSPPPSSHHPVPVQRRALAQMTVGLGMDLLLATVIARQSPRMMILRVFLFIVDVPQ